ncbi:hypothetical protein Tco_0353622 [Tanacetum coccineum]
MIKEHDQQANTKATPRRLTYADSDKEAPAGSLARSFFDRFSLESFGTSDTRRQTRSADKSQRNPSKNKKPSYQRRSKRLEERSRTKEKVGRPKSRGRTSGYQETSSDSEYEEEFLQQKRYAKDPTEIHDIKRRQNKGLQAFMDRFKSESSHIKGVPPVLRILAFMHGHGHPELAKKLNDKIPKTMDEMFERVRAFIRGEVAAGSAELVRPSQWDKKNVRLAWSGGSEKARNRSEEAVDSGKLAHLVKDIRQNNQRNGSQGRNNVKVINMVRGGRNRKRPFKGERSCLTDELTFPAIPQNRLTDEPIILKGMIEDHQAKKLQSSTDMFLGRNIPPFGDNRPSSNYGRGRKEKNSADGVYNSKMSFAVQRHNRKDRNEKPQSGRHLEKVQGSWKEV